VVLQHPKSVFFGDNLPQWVCPLNRFLTEFGVGKASHDCTLTRNLSAAALQMWA